MKLTNEQLQSLRNHGNECEDAADEITELRGRIAELETRLNESRQLYDVAVPLCHEQKDIGDDSNLVRLINDHLRQLAPHVRGRESAQLLDEAARELAAAKQRIAELETRLACARAETVHEFIKAMCSAMDDFVTPEVLIERLDALAIAPPGYRCVPIEPTEDMRIAGESVLNFPHSVRMIFQAMLAAARKP